MHVLIRVIALSLFFAACFNSRLAATDDLFREKIAPILARHCLSCHNDAESEGEFSVSSAETFFDAGFVEPGDAAASYLIELVTAESGKRPDMPKTGAPLTVAETESIKNWIDSGAKWPSEFVVTSSAAINFDWWAYQPLERPAEPVFDDPPARQWIRTPIDAFILRGLRDWGLSPSEPADRQTMIRRLSYDLTGLPPTAVEISEFSADSSTNAYEKLVDRLLASPRYGERWARHWLDVVKYADTCGYDKDKLRNNAWPYRDYVIRSLNDDKPYARFVAEQIAGDYLFPGTADGVLGLGFIAAGPWDFIGHVEVPESKKDGKVARNLDRDDMVTNTINTFCSVTIQCARCHDHKFDPFTQEHYYGLQAVFAAVDRADRVYADDPAMVARRAEIQQSLAMREKQLADIEARIDLAGGDKISSLDAQIEQAQGSKKRPQFGYHSEIAGFAEVEKWVELEFTKPRRCSSMVLRPCHDDFADIGAGFGFPLRYRVEVDGKTVFEQSDDLENPGLAPVEIPIRSLGSRFRIVATKLAERKKDFIFALAELQMLDDSGSNLALQATIGALDSIEMPVRWQKSNLTDGIWYEAGDQRLTALHQKRNELVKELVGQAMVDRQRHLAEQIAIASKELDGLPAGKLVYAAATEFPQQGNFKPTMGRPREVRLLARGEVTSGGKLVEPGVLPFSGNDRWALALPDEATEGQRRAALASWLIDPEHPLTWRSIVNRVWQYHFGRGIVETPNDLGRMGGLPSHPQLLDWLAVEFRDRGGSLKDLHRLIVTSSVYRQASTHSSQANEIDSENRMLWKVNRRRLSAEEIRDSLLMASGQLNLDMGGPGYYLFELEKTEHSPHYEYHKFDHTDSSSYRRAIYRFVVRSQPDPYMETLDCADSSQSTPTRSETQTPLQSLTMLNSDFTLVMAERLAARIRAESDSIDSQIILAIRATLGRDPTRQEQQVMREYVAQHGLENLARIIFNLSEFVYVD